LCLITQKVTATAEVSMISYKCTKIKKKRQIHLKYKGKVQAKITIKALKVKKQ
jgi:hypothetical protein